MDPATFAHAPLIHISHDFADCFFYSFYATLPIAGDRICTLHDGVFAPVLAFTFRGRLN